MSESSCPLSVVTETSGRQRDTIGVMGGRVSRANAVRTVLDPRSAANVLAAMIGLNRAGERARLEEALLAAGRVMRALGSDDPVTTLGEELELVESWLALQKLRFDTRLSFRIDAEPGIRGLPVRRFLVFGPVTDAVERSVEPPGVGGRIVIRCRSTGRHGLRISVTDGGSTETVPTEPLLRQAAESR